MRTIALFIQLLVLAAYGQTLRKPDFSVNAGYYADSVVLSMSSPESGASIRYTTNGEEPGPNSTLYTGPLIIKNRSKQVNTISMVPTNPSFSYPKNGYDIARAQSRGWLPPYDTVFKATVVKAKLFKNGYASDSSRIATYVVKESTKQIYSLPVLSLSIDSASLFAFNNGIYVYGADSLHDGNYSNDTASRKAYIEFFETDGTLAFGQYADIKIHGNGGRHAPQKSLLIKAQKEYGNGSIDYRVFVGSAVKKYDKLLLRNSGHRPDCMPRDDIGQDFLASLGNLVQRNRHCIVFINGEYWGIQTLKDIFDDNYFFRRYHIPKDLSVMLTQTGSLDEGVPGDEEPYSDLLNFLSSNDMAQAENYAYAASKMDLESFSNFECGEIFLGNGDWPNNNTKFWRYKGSPTIAAANTHLDGRWRWLFYDLDAAFGGDCSGIYPTFNALTRATDAAYGNFTKPLRSLLTNPEFKIYFINRYADLLNSHFLASRLLASVNKIGNTMNPEIAEHVERWRYPAMATTLQNRALEVPSPSKWNTILSGLSNFSAARAEKTRRQFMNYFSLPDTFHLTLDVNDSLKGRIRVNSLTLDSWLVRNTTSVYPWSGIYFTGNPVSISALPYPGYRFSHWNNPTDTAAQIISSFSADINLTAHFVADTAFRPWHYLYINEVMASNTAHVTDEYFEHDDWIELYNPHNVEVDVSGYFVSDDAQLKTKYCLRTAGKQTVIKPHGFLLVWADDDVEQGSLHANFKLNKAGSSLFLVLPDGNGLVDSVTFGGQTENHSFGRKEDGNATWTEFDEPTPNASNHLPEIPEPEAFIVYPNPAGGELFFTRTEDVVVFDLLGKQLISAQHVKQLNIMDLATGIYFIRTSTGQNVKFIRK